MTVGEMAKALGLSAVYLADEARPVPAAYTSDLLSDAMGNAPDEAALITIQAHKNTVAVATLKDSPAIILCNDRPVPDDMVEAVKSEGISLFVTGDNQFTVSGKLYPLFGR
ncbi:MAG: hypothetical protein LBS97_04560 [Treponema sp.]|jgi:hypothetical protein|nr:hypothetical protein [Treponema sp.]